MQYWIDKLGFWGYMKQFPINPITIVGCVALVGIIVLVISARARRRKAERFLANNAGAATMTFHKKQLGNNDYADNIRILKLNGEAAHWFFLKPAIPAVYLRAGESTIELYADWARQGGGTIKTYKSEPVSIRVSALNSGCYSLEYLIPENRFIFEKYDNPKLFGK